MTPAPSPDPKAAEADAALWKILFDSHPDPLMFLDCEHRVVRVNQAQAKALGCQPEEVVGRYCFEVMHGSDDLVEGCPHSCMVRESREQTAEVMVDRLGGLFLVTVKPIFNPEGRLIGALHVAREVSAGKDVDGEFQKSFGTSALRVESRAKELRNRLYFKRLLLMMMQRLSPNIQGSDFHEMLQQEVARVAEALGFGRCVFLQAQDDVLRVVVRCECASAKLPPLPDTVTRESAPLLFSVAEHEGFIRAVERGVLRCATGKFVSSSDVPSFLLLVECDAEASGCAFFYEDSLRLMCEIVGAMLLHAADASDTQSLRQKLMQADRVARLGQLTATLAHELNQPLAATLCNAQAAVRLLEMDPPDVKEARSALGDIVESARLAGAVLRHTRALFRGGLLSRQPVDLNLLVRRVLGLVKGDTVLSGATVKTHLMAGLPPVMGDEIQLQQVVRNLLVNACDAVCDKPKHERIIKVSSRVSANGDVELCVQDSGVGLVEGLGDKIFEPFYTTKPEGQGMGLSICKQIVLSHGGEIRAEAVPEGGALFRITLPSLPDEASR